MDELLIECRVLGRQYGAAQARCSRIFDLQRRRIAALEAALLRARAQLVVEVTRRWLAEAAAEGAAEGARPSPARPAGRRRGGPHEEAARD